MTQTILSKSSPADLIDFAGENAISPAEVAAIHGRWYVAVTDSFMSGWGSCQHRTNRVYLACDGVSDAESVARFIRANRPEARRVTVQVNPPKASDRGTMRQLMTRETAPAWYPAD